MDLRLQKRLASQVLKCSSKRVRFTDDRMEEIKEAITRKDVLSLAKDGAIIKKAKLGISQSRARKTKRQKRKGLRTGPGSRKGKKKARNGGKSVWVAKVRIQREFIRTLRDKEIITKDTFKGLNSKVKGGFFRSKRHIKVFIEERQLLNEKK
ncbi:50S ribosomal protein L19e [Candidatus Woesearchaeota archaeon CG08_land_8_20_14_0_20_43_7]|nr:MAG: 50S ribosomal protein L19e [Candidatus Woesearchaeota archaeon CG08_land_8_20_14_0_20_43_7]